MTQIANAIEAFAAGDHSAFATIHDTFQPKLWKFLCARSNNREDAEDLYNIVSLAVAQNIHTLKDSGKLTSWVIGIAVFRISDYYQNKKSNVSLDEFIDAESEILIDPTDSCEQEVISGERLLQIRTCIRKLPQPQRGYFEMQFLAEIPQKDIAENLDVNLNLIKSHIRRSKIRVLECLRHSGIQGDLINFPKQACASS